MTNREIGARLRWSVGTAKKYLQRALEKLGAVEVLGGKSEELPSHERGGDHEHEARRGCRSQYPHRPLDIAHRR
ncbi:MAG: hypothetical protein DMD99_20225 [Candidatus Rokuibacteriota bacterium]|nr:MAG: hypothetical protein DMD99_20225 [Candidatus Rokubacteria bacterium]